MRARGLALAIVAVAALPAAAQSFDARAYLDAAIAIVRGKALDADKVDWTALSARVHAQGDAAQDVFDTYPALVTLVRGLGDHHSFLQLSQERTDAYRAAKGKPFDYPADPSAKPDPDRHFVGRSEIESADHTYARGIVRTLVVPAFMGAPDAARAYAGKLFGAVTGGQQACGYVVDLRGNTGGNMWPMLAGLSPLLGNAMLGGYTGREGDERWFVDGAKAGIVAADGTRQVASDVGDDPPRGMASLPVALLLDGHTASSGEIVAVAFGGRPLTRSFGTHTAGISTATQGFALPDGANLVVVTDVTFDRTGKRYPSGLTPDVTMARDTAQGAADNVRGAAEAWVASRCSRAPRR